MRIAIVHDWLTGMRGGEKVLRLLCGLLPGADLLTLVHVRGSCDPAIERMRIRTSFLNDLPAAGRCYRHLLPLMPLAIERLDATGYDLVLSSSHCVAKGVVAPGAAHVCYCYTPMRYVWSRTAAYGSAAGLSAAALKAFAGYLRAWDRRSAGHVDRFLAISRTVAGRIARAYGRGAEVIYPPVDTSFYTPAPVAREDFYLCVGALVPYKRTDQAMAAFAELGRPLRIIGAGPELRRLARRCPPNVTMMGWQDDATIRDHCRRCRGLVFPGEEDFGIVPVEAMACGAPVIAFGAGGAAETVVDVDDRQAESPTGVLYARQTVEGLVAAVRRFEQVQERFDPRRAAARAQEFGTPRFLRQFREALRPWIDLSQPDES